MATLMAVTETGSGHGQMPPNPTLDGRNAALFESIAAFNALPDDRFEPQVIDLRVPVSADH